MGVFTKIKEAVKDMSSLEVQTFTGTIKGFVKAPTSTSASKADKVSVIDWKKLLGTANAGGSEIELAAVTLIKFDGDTQLFLSNSPTVAPNVIESHQRAVESAQQVRSAVVDLFKDLIKNEF